MPEVILSDYFYDDESEEFVFFKILRQLITNPKFKHVCLTEDERYVKEGMLLAGAGPTEIARKMGICHQTVYNEMNRGLYVHTYDLRDEIRYSADKAQQIHEYNQTAKGRPLKIRNDHALADYLEKKMLGIQPDRKRDRRKRFFSISPARTSLKRSGPGKKRRSRSVGPFIRLYRPSWRGRRRRTGGKSWATRKLTWSWGGPILRQQRSPSRTGRGGTQSPTPAALS